MKSIIESILDKDFEAKALSNAEFNVKFSKFNEKVQQTSIIGCTGVDALGRKIEIGDDVLCALTCLPVGETWLGVGKIVDFDNNKQAVVVQIPGARILPDYSKADGKKDLALLSSSAMIKIKDVNKIKNL